MATSLDWDTNSSTCAPISSTLPLSSPYDKTLINPLLLLVLLILLPLLYYIYDDYKAFISLGPGGTPPTFTGYLRVSFLRIFALREPCVPYPIPNFLQPSVGFLHNIPHRTGPRPKVTGIAPHRQTTQKGTEHNFAALSHEICQLARRHPTRLRIGTSCFEKHGTGIFSISPAHATCQGEICHAHPSDGSLHMTLHLADAQVVLERGWGERHPLAKGGWLTRFVPTSFVMIYAPRDTRELKVVMDIVRAAAWWVSGQDLEADCRISSVLGNWLDKGEHHTSRLADKQHCEDGVAGMVRGD